MESPRTSDMRARARFIRDQNIQKFHRMLASEHDEDKRRLLLALIDAEYEKQFTRTFWPPAGRDRN